MTGGVGFIELTILKDSEGCQGRVTISVANIASIAEVATSDSVSRTGTVIILRERPEYFEPWAFQESPGVPAFAPEACGSRRIIVQETYDVVRYLVSRANGKPGVYSRRDFEDLMLAIADPTIKTRLKRKPSIEY